MAKEGIPNKAEKHVEEVVKRFNASEIGDAHCFFDGKIINSFLNCSYKAFLSYHNELGIKTEYELLEFELLQKYKRNFFNKVYENQDEIHILKSLESINDIQCKKSIHMIDQVFQYDQFSLHFDALEINPLKDSSRDFLYIPVSVSPNEKISTTEKLLLSTKSLLLGTLYNITPE